MRLSEQHVRSQFRSIEERIAAVTRAEKAAKAYLDFTAVCLVGYAERVPRAFGDLDGCWPVRVTTTAKPRQITKKSDLEQPLYGIYILGLVWCETDAHAKRLKASLDRQLLGEDRVQAPGYLHNGGPPMEEAVNPRRLRHGWRSLEDEPDLAWPLLLLESLREIRKREWIDVFDEDERQRRIRQAKMNPSNCRR